MDILVACAAVAAVLCSGPLTAQTGADRGRELYESRCGGCHSLDANRVGPMHRGVHGRISGSAPGFAYSAAVKGARITWNDDALDRWLADPQKLIPGQRMNFRVGSAADRADIIAYLRRESGR